MSMIDRQWSLELIFGHEQSFPARQLNARAGSKKWTQHEAAR